MHESILKNLDFELIIVKQKNNRYKATAPSFPHCKGFGNTKKEAITKLCSSIANFIKESTQDFLKLHLLSNNYTEVITDPNNKEDFQHRIINVGTKSNIVDHRIFLKSINPMLNSINISNDDSDSFDLFNLVNGANPQENDDLILGINVCLN
tara:strand:+ start:213 stop:668 length:456 start_codon:yes stop_codon:yes gene_type:complete